MILGRRDKEIVQFNMLNEMIGVFRTSLLRIILIPKFNFHETIVVYIDFSYRTIKNDVVTIHLHVFFYIIWLKVLLWQIGVATNPHVFVIATCI